MWLCILLVMSGLWQLLRGRGMTDEAKALVADLRDYGLTLDPGTVICGRRNIDLAADLIETQAREIERLQRANQAAAEYVAAMMQECARYRDEIRAALGESHDQ